MILPGNCPECWLFVPRIQRRLLLGDHLIRAGRCARYSVSASCRSSSGITTPRRLICCMTRADTRTGEPPSRTTSASRMSWLGNLPPSKARHSLQCYPSFLVRAWGARRGINASPPLPFRMGLPSNLRHNAVAGAKEEGTTLRLDIQTIGVLASLAPRHPSGGESNRGDALPARH